MRNEHIKTIIFLSLLGALCLPYVQSKINLVELVPLNGVFEKIPDPEFIFKDWFHGEYQKKYDKFTEENIGFRNCLIRTYNQIDYSCFNLGHGDNVIPGKNGFLFQQAYFDSYLGKNYVGDSLYDIKLKDLDSAQSVLRSKGIDLITVLAPNKSRFFAEYADELDAKTEKKYSYYDYLIKNYKKLGINLIDFNKWFLDMKNTSKYPLFPKQGVHWSYYGAALVVDSMIHYLEITHNKKMNEFSYSLELTDSVRGTDYDLGDLMNLFIKMKPFKMAYPKFTFSNSTESWKPRILVIGDSFYWTIYNWGILGKLCAKDSYWYYSTTIYPGEGSVQDLDLQKEVFNYDIILLLQSEPGYCNPGYYFVDNLVSKMTDEKKYADEFNAKIRNVKSWLARMQEKSRVQNNDINLIISQMADSLAKIKSKRLFEIIHQMRSDQEWLHTISEKSKAQNISLDEMMKIDALWLYEQENPVK